MVSDVDIRKESDSLELNGTEPSSNDQKIIENNQLQDETVESSVISSKNFVEEMDIAVRVVPDIPDSNTAQDSVEVSVYKSSEPPIKDHMEQPFTLSTGHKLERADGKITAIMFDKPTKEHANQLAKQLTQKTIEQPIEHPNEQLIEQQIGQLIRQPSEQPNEQSIEQSTDQLIEQSAEKLISQHSKSNFLNCNIQSLELHHIASENDQPVKPVNPGESKVTRTPRDNIDSKEDHDIWDLQHDLLLRYLKENAKLGWKEISQYFNNKSSNSCQFRWRRLKSDHQKNGEATNRDIHSIDIKSTLKGMTINKKLQNYVASLENNGKKSSEQYNRENKLLVEPKTKNELVLHPKNENPVFWDLQTDLLLRYLKEVKNFDWIDVSQYFINKTPDICEKRWYRLRNGPLKVYHSVPMDVYSIDAGAILKNMGIHRILPDLISAAENTYPTTPIKIRRNANLVESSDEMSDGTDPSFKLKSETSFIEAESVNTLSQKLVKKRGRKPGKKKVVGKKSVGKRGTSNKKRKGDAVTNKSPKKRKTTKQEEEEEKVYGILEKPNINQVQFGLDKLFRTWYGSAVYFEKDKRTLGIYSVKDRHTASTDKVGRSSSKYNDSDYMEEGDEDKKAINNDSDIGDDPNYREKESESIWLDTLYVCEYCFKYTTDPEKLKLHDAVCKYKLNKPPGKIKYRSPEYTIRRVKGYKEKLFCQCLCLFTKLFLDNKSIYFKVENYDFFILYKTGQRKPMAFFSKDITSFNQNNLACILTLPPYQKRRLGSLLIEFSYKLSRSEGLISGPELPLSPFGLIGYINHWGKVICSHILNGDLTHLTSVTINDISLVTGFRIEDIIMTLNYLKCLDEETGTININQMFVWLKSRNKKNEGLMLQDEYLMISD